MEIVLTLATTLENVSNRKETFLISIIVCSFFCQFKELVENYPISLSQCKPLTPISDQDKISPHNIKTISSRQVMTIKKNFN